MTETQYQELIEFLAAKFDGVNARFDRLEERVTVVEVSLESLRDEVRQLAEGLTAINERFDRLEASVNARFDAGGR